MIFRKLQTPYLIYDRLRCQIYLSAAMFLPFWDFNKISIFIDIEDELICDYL